MAKYIGIDIGGTKCATLIAEDDGDGLRFISRIEEKTAGGYRTIIAKLKANIRKQLEKAGLTVEDIKSIGIACGGPLNEETGVILSPPNLPDWDGVPVCEMFREEFSLPCYLMNDANACALAEYKYGAGVGAKNFVFMTYGTGLGAGMVLNGNLYVGSSSMAGEVGHIRISTQGETCYHKKGCFESFCSGAGMRLHAIRYLKKELDAGREIFWDAQRLEELTVKDIKRFADEGNKQALHIYAKAGYYLGKGLAILVDIVNPDRICIGGIYTRAEKYIRPQMLKMLKKEALPEAVSAVRVVPSVLKEQIGDYSAVTVAKSRE